MTGERILVWLFYLGVAVLLSSALVPVVHRWLRKKREKAVWLEGTRLCPRCGMPWRYDSGIACTVPQCSCSQHPRRPCPVCRGHSAKVHPGEKYPRVTCSLCNNTGEAPDDR